MRTADTEGSCFIEAARIASGLMSLHRLLRARPALEYWLGFCLYHTYVYHTSKDDAIHFLKSLERTAASAGGAIHLRRKQQSFSHIPGKSKTLLEQWQEKNEHMAKHARIGNGAPICRNLVAGSGGTYVMETIPEDQKDPYKHFINLNGITNLINIAHPETALAQK